MTQELENTGPKSHSPQMVGLPNLMKRFFGLQMSLNLSDTIFILNHHPQPNIALTISPEKVAERIRYNTILGIVIPVFLCIYQRRYFPSMFYSASSNKFVLEFTVIGGGLFLSLINGLFSVEKAVRQIKKQLYLGGDNGVKQYVRWVRMAFEIDEETQLKLMMDKEQFQKWKSDREVRVHQL